PVNGPWYDYIGIDASQRNAFSTKINEIVKEAGVKQVDLTSHDYDPYYIWDATHPGWKGWPLVEKELVKFFKENG
ncbi:MAG: D-alanyl-lipoteichoic acid biosynthesis protein DltD, partial [Streptococcus sp.]|nr:D-alanyl-lipoteichoic acid biosynthesis protein DltD [Streptococcus sp.]